jgi:hypothetical protein
MKLALASAALAAVLAAPALAQQPPATTMAPPVAAGSVRASINADAPQAKTEVTVDTSVEETATATIETKTETITPVQTAQLDPENPIAVEVQAVVSGKPRYTTKDIAQAQLDAVLAAPASIPTTTITTKTTTLKPGQ